MPITVRGSQIVTWLPNYNLSLSSPDGTELDADGEVHPLIATLVSSTTLLPAPNKCIRLNTVGSGRVGDNAQKFTNGAGQVTFRVSSEVDETVDYTAYLLAQPNGPFVLDSNTVAIQWGEEAIPVVASAQGVSANFAVTMSVQGAFDDDCTAGRFVVIAVTCGLGFSQVITVVQDTLGTPYALIKSATAVGNNIVSVYGGVVPSSGPNTAKITVTSDGTAPFGYGAGFVACEYANSTVSVTDPPISASQTRVNALSATMTAGVLAPAFVDGTVYIGVGRGPQSNGGTTVTRSYATGFNERVALTGISAGIGPSNFLSLYDTLDETIVGAVVPSIDWVSSNFQNRSDETVALALE